VRRRDWRVFGTAPCSGQEKGDASQFPVLLDLGPDVDPRAGIGDKGYDSNASRLAANRIRSGGSTPARCALPRRQCCATTNFSSAAARPPGQACQCREKQQRPGLSPTAVIKAQVPREVRSQRAAPIRGSRWRRYFDIFFFFAFFVAMAYFLLA
jgi:hypothetical protein